MDPTTSKVKGTGQPSLLIPMYVHMLTMSKQKQYRRHGTYPQVNDKGPCTSCYCKDSKIESDASKSQHQNVHKLTISNLNEMLQILYIIMLRALSMSQLVSIYLAI